MTTIYILDPRDTANPSPAALAIRPASLGGKAIGLLSNNKPHSEELLRMVAGTIGHRYSLAKLVEYKKAGHQWPAVRSALEDLARSCDVMIHATGE